MASIIEELQRREDAARAEANRLREQIEHLAQELARAEERASRLAIAREEVADVLDEDASPDLEAGRAIRHDDQDTASASRFGSGSPIGVMAVPPWREGMTPAQLPRPYQDILDAYADARRPVRAGHVAEALGLPTDRSAVEGLRSKLKRLVERGWLVEDGGPGLYALPAHQRAAKMPEPRR
ncbi:hypothetical protein [Streptomyces hokutonensis]|uniref:Uncharacterized protein n=1 Tax=Streptomyces hokutonensis TaxID=1306990 RepID=A0ABW6MFX7_9ACTN